MSNSYSVLVFTLGQWFFLQLIALVFQTHGPSTDPDHIRPLSLTVAVEFHAGDASFSDVEASLQDDAESDPSHQTPSFRTAHLIFEIVKALTEGTSPWNGQRVEVTSMLWPPLTHVCRLWRDTIQCVPSLWRSIHIMNDMQRVRQCLDRSEGVPIEVYIHSLSELPDARGLLIKNVHRPYRAFRHPN